MIDTSTGIGVALSYQRRRPEGEFKTEEYVSSPPAAWIVEEDGTCWTLGFNRGEAPHGEYAFNVMRDGVNTGEWASRIERRNGRIRCFTKDGWKIWNGHSFF